jgi:hypothetical protein
LAVGALLTLSTGLTGCSGLSNASAPGTITSATATSSDRPDVAIRRVFQLPDGSTEQGCLTLTVKSDPSSQVPATQQDLARARAIVTEPRWQTESISLNELPAGDLKRMRDRGESDGVILAGLLKDHIQSALDEAGADKGISTAGFVGCR